MLSISVATYARIFNSDTINLREAAGNYENTITTKIAKGIVGVLTLGIGYGIIRLVEEYDNVKPKIDEFCSNAEEIHKSLSEAVVYGNKSIVSVKLKDNKEITFKLKINEEENKLITSNGCGNEKEKNQVIISDGLHSEYVDGTFKEICLTLEREFNHSPGYYNLSNEYRPLHTRVSLVNLIIHGNNNMEEYDEYADKYERFDANIARIHKELSDPMVRKENKVNVTLEDNSEIEFRQSTTGRVIISDGFISDHTEDTLDDIYLALEKNIKENYEINECPPLYPRASLVDLIIHGNNNSMEEYDEYAEKFDANIVRIHKELSNAVDRKENKVKVILEDNSEIEFTQNADGVTIYDRSRYDSSISDRSIYGHTQKTLANICLALGKNIKENYQIDS